MDDKKKELLKKFYEYYSSKNTTIKERKLLQSQVLYNLYQKPKKEKAKDKAHYTSVMPEQIVQVDLLTLPKDKGFPYCLVAVDIGSGLCDAQPTRDKTAPACLAAIEVIFERDIIKQPKLQISCDSGGEFKGVFKDYFDNQNIKVKYGVPGRHKQQAYVENRNRQIGKAIFLLQTAEELLTGKPATHWVDELPTIIKGINSHAKPMTKARGFPRIDNTTEFFNVGDKVRIKLAHPVGATGEKLFGSFRETDMRWSIKTFTIEDVILLPNQPPLYKLNDNKNWFTYKELKLTTDAEEMPPKNVIKRNKANKEKQIKKIKKEVEEVEPRRSARIANKSNSN